MCYPCKHCGQCEKGKTRPLEQCPLCNTVNETGAAVCKGCGFVFPPRPGSDAAPERPAEVPRRDRR